MSLDKAILQQMGISEGATDTLPILSGASGDDLLTEALRGDKAPVNHRSFVGVREQIRTKLESDAAQVSNEQEAVQDPEEDLPPELPTEPETKEPEIPEYFQLENHPFASRRVDDTIYLLSVPFSIQRSHANNPRFYSWRGLFVCI